MKKVQQGFTLIELMIVVAIVGILAAVALPAYQDYTVRARISEGLARLAEAKTSVAEFFAANNRVPSNTVSAGFNSAAAGNVTSVTCAGGDCGVIRLTMNSTAIPQLAGANMIDMSVTASANGMLVWRCRAASATPVNNRYLPASCK